MPSLRELADKIGAFASANAKRSANASRYVKLILITGGAAISAIALGVDVAHSNHEISAWTIAGFAGAALVVLGSGFLAFTETDAAELLEAARVAIEEARFAEREKAEFQNSHARLNKAISRGLELYNSMDVMRGAIEQSLSIPNRSAGEIIQTCLEAAYNSLLVAFDFKIEDTWTICVYIAEWNRDSKRTLRCIAHKRKIECDIRQARAWPEGVGFVGFSYSMGNENIIPDMYAPELGNVFNLKDNSRPYDLKRYRSMVAVPIMVGDAKTPWGIAVVTSDRAHHFRTEAPDGVSTAEPIRAIAAMSALAVKAVEMGVRANKSLAPRTNSGDGPGAESDENAEHR